jgi:hypothetical protein
MTRFVGLDCSQKMTCAIDNAGRRLWRGSAPQFQNRSATWCFGMREINTHPDFCRSL